MLPAPATLLEAITHFADHENCRAYMIRPRWPDGVVKCPNCQSIRVQYLPNAKVCKCYEKHPRQKLSFKVGTIFEDSPLGLDKWLPAVWLITSCKNGISSSEVHRALGVSQKTAWFMLHRIRLAMQDEGHGGKVGGSVEVDEAYIGGSARNMQKATNERALGSKGGGVTGKVGVQGMLERVGKIRAVVIENSKFSTLAPNVWKYVQKGSDVHPDEAHA